MTNPGGFKPPNDEGWIGRKFGEIDRALRELRAANPFAPMGMTPTQGGVSIDGNLNVAGTANFTGNTTIGGTATVTGNITKTNGWGGSSLGPVVFSAQGAPGLTFTKDGTTYGQPVGIGLTRNSADTADQITIKGPHASDPPFLLLRSDGAFSLRADNTAGPAAFSTPGPDGTLGVYGGTANGSVNLNSYGTGNVQVNGNFRVTGTKAFIMDHPVHPDTMKLMHAATESDRNGVEYWGTSTIDAVGKASVTLPDYFEALTKATGRNIQLTPIGSAAAQVSADRIVDGSFAIYGAPGQEVDWLVKAERQRIVDGHDELAFDAEQSAL